MKNLKYKLLQYVPFAGLVPKTNDNFSQNQKAINILSSIFMATFLPIYLVSSFSFKAPMFSKEWKQNTKQYNQEEQFQEKIQQQNIYRNQFNELDKNKDYLIDSAEFIYR